MTPDAARLPTCLTRCAPGNLRHRLDALGEPDSQPGAEILAEALRRAASDRCHTWFTQRSCGVGRPCFQRGAAWLNLLTDDAGPPRIPNGPLRIGVVGMAGGWSSESLADRVAERTGFRLLVDMEHVSARLDEGRVLFGDSTSVSAMG